MYVYAFVPRQLCKKWMWCFIVFGSFTQVLLDCRNVIIVKRHIFRVAWDCLFTWSRYLLMWCFRVGKLMYYICLTHLSFAAENNLDRIIRFLQSTWSNFSLVSVDFASYKKKENYRFIDLNSACETDCFTFFLFLQTSIQFGNCKPSEQIPHNGIGNIHWSVFVAAALFLHG